MSRSPRCTAPVLMVTSFLLFVSPVPAQDYTASEVALLGHLSLAEIGAPSGIAGNDIWGWTDSRTNREYALFGLQNGTSFVDVTDPFAPVYLGTLPTHTGVSTWRDIKVYDDHAFIVADNNGPHGMQVFNLQRLDGVTVPETFSEDAHDSSFRSAHNIAINEDTGYAYIVGSNQAAGGIHFINIQDPLNPFEVGGFSADGYTHDAQIVTYQGPDTRYTGQEIAVASNEDALTIVDVTDKSAPSMLGTGTYGTAAYIHQGWFSEDQRFFFQNDELDEFFFGTPTSTHVWDLQDLTNPTYLGFYEHETGALDHNLYVKDDLIFEANYTAGLRVLQVNDASTLDIEEIAFFDTVPSTDGPGSGGLWSVYPYFDSGNIILSDINQGLYIVKLASCDLDDDGDCDIDDIDLLTAEGDLTSGEAMPSDEKFDYVEDEVVDTKDLEFWLNLAGRENGFLGPYLPGDANLDGTVNTDDFNTWVNNRFQSGKNWSDGDWDGNGSVDLADLHIWNQNKFAFSIPGDDTLVPEPTGLFLGTLGVLLIGALRQRARAPGH